MEMLKKFFPYSFGAASVADVVIKVLVYLVASAIIGWVLGLIPLVGGIVATVVGLYALAGAVITVLDYLKVLK